MPGNKSDGSITIDTKLDNTKFEKDSDRLKRAVKSLSDQVNRTGCQMTESLKIEFSDPKQAANAVSSSFSKAMKQVSSEVSDMYETGEKALTGDSKAFEQMAQKGDQAINQINTQPLEGQTERLKDMVGSLQDQIVKTSDQVQNALNIDFGKPVQIINTFSRALGQVGGDINELSELAEAAINGDEEAMERFKERSDEVIARLEKLKEENLAYGEKEFDTPEYAKVKEQYAEATLQVDQFRRALEEAESAQEVLIDSFNASDAMGGLINRRRELVDYMNNADKMDPNTRTQRAVELNLPVGGVEEALKQVEAEIDKVQQKFYDSGPYKSSQREIDKMTSGLVQAEERAAQYKSEMDSMPNKTFSGFDTTNYEKNSAQLEQAIDKFHMLRQAVRESTMAAGPAMTVFAETAMMIGDVAIAAGKAAAKLAKMAGVGVLTGLKNIAVGAKNAAIQLAKMAKNTAVSGLKKLKDHIAGVGKSSKGMGVSLKGGFKTILKYGLGIRSLYILFRKLRSAITDGFGEIAKVDPVFGQTVNNFKTALTTLKNSFAAAFAPIAQVVMPLLTQLINGLSKAFNFIGQIAAALTGQKSFTGAVATQTANADAASSSADAMNKEAKAAKEVKKQLAGFDDVEILSEDKDTDTSSGGTGGSGFATTPISAEASDWAKKLKDMWANADFTELGRMLGEKLRDALNRIPWDRIKEVLRKIGKSIATFLNGFLETPGLFDAIGRTIAEGINSAFEFVNAFVQNFHWDSLGNAIKEGILGITNNLDWDLIFSTLRGIGSGFATAINSALNNPEIWTGILTTIANGFNALVYGLQTFVTTVQWGSIGSNIATGLNNAVQTIDWTAAGQTLSAGIIGLLNLFIGFVETFDWKAFGEKIKEFLIAIDWQGIFDAVFEAIGAVLGGLAAFLWGLIEEAWNNVVQWWKDTAYEDGKLTISGLLNGILEALKNIATWIKDHIFTPFIEGFKKAFGIASPSKEMMMQGQYIAQGMLDGITDKIKSIGTWVKTNVFDKVKGAFENAFGVVSGAASKIKDIGESVISGLKSGAEGRESSLTGSLSSIAANVYSTLSSPSTGSWSDIGSNIISGIESGIQSGWSWLSTTVSNLASSLFNTACTVLGIQSPSRVFRDGVGKMITAGLAWGIDQGAPEAVKTVASLADAITQEAENAEPRMKIDTTMGDVTSGIDTVLTGFSDKVVGAFENMIAAMDNIASGSSFVPPAVATGSVTPYSARRAATPSEGSRIRDAIDNLALQRSDGISRKDLIEVLTQIVRDYLNISFYIGDEQVARHANAGNMKLNRRYSPTVR